jgi:glycosyltransferase involved in cell wall biosynthesis
MIGRIEAYKNPLEFIRIARLIGDISPFSFWLCGCPSDSRLESDLIAENHDNVVNLEFAMLSEERFVSLISSARVVCLPYSDATDSGIAPVCFALGAPIIAYSVGGLVDTIVHGFNGYLVPPGDVTEFSNCVFRICSQDSVFEQLSSGAREASILHSPEGVYDSVLRAFP